MSTELTSSQVQAANANPATATPPGDSPELQDALAEKTLAMIGGAPKGEVQRLDDLAQAQLDRGGVETPASAAPAAPAENEPDATANLEAARLAELQAAASQQAFEAQRHAVLGDAMRQYPDLGNRESLLWKVAAQLAREAHDPTNADHQAGKSMEAPRYFAAKAANLLRMQPADGRASLPASGTADAIAAQWQRQSRPGPASGSRQTLPPPPEPSLEQRVANSQAKTLAMIGGHSGAEQDDDHPPVLVL